jgi:hypothetical protein
VGGVGRFQNDVKAGPVQYYRLERFIKLFINMDIYSIETMHDIKQIISINHAHLGQGKTSHFKVEISEITV